MTSNDAPVSRRERARRDTLAEIRATGRKILAQEGPAAISLRAIAREMGMTAPGLYRYYSQHRDLVQAITADVYDELAGDLEEIRAKCADEPPGVQLVAVARGLRRWALDHRPELTLLFSKPITDVDCGPEDPCHEASWRFGGLILDLMIACWRAGAVPRASAGASADLIWLGQLDRLRVRSGDDVPLEVLYAFVSAWVRLYGMISMEVFGHLDFALTDPEPFFEDGLRQFAELLGVADALA